MPAPLVRGEGGREEVGGVGGGLVQRQHPSGCGELGGPDDVQLQHVRLGCTGVQPLHVQLMALVGCVGRDAQLDAHAGMLLLERRELLLHQAPFRAERAGRQRHERAIVGPAASDHRCTRQSGKQRQPVAKGAHDFTRYPER